MAVIASGEIPLKAGKPTKFGLKMFVVYILKSSINGRFYTGHTADLEKRLAEHNRGKVKSTKAYKPWEIIYTEKLNTKSEAFNREMQLKSYKHGEAFLRLIN